ncbi:hypothetical protein CEXT_310081, partial [Caerostris extrusa]
VEFEAHSISSFIGAYQFTTELIRMPRCKTPRLKVAEETLKNLLTAAKYVSHFL